MRGFLASSIGVTCAAALALPLSLPAVAAPVAPAAPSANGARSASMTVAPDLPGSTQSLPLVPRTRDRTLGAAPEQGLTRDDVHRFSLVGVIWDDPDTALRGRVQVRTRATGTGKWSGWQDVDTHNEDHGADPGTAERDSGHVHGSTAPLWVGDSDGVDVRVRADTGTTRAVGNEAALPAGLHLELVDPGADPPPAGARAATDGAAAPLTEETVEASAANTDLVPLGATEVPALSRRATERELVALRFKAQPYIGPRPRIVTRRGWGADEKLREKGFVYTKKVKAAFVHHTATGNNYRCSQAPSVIRGIYRYHVRSSGWRDIGYNFLVDKCGTIYEGRAGGVAKAVLGAHTLGFNTNSMGIAVLGTFGSAKPSSAAVKAIARLTAWKLGLYGANPRGKTYLKSGGGNLYRKGKNVRLNVISGHRDGYATDCPGRQLYGKLGSARSTSARYQGR
ncbi:N-acetylmuramoyl-L-alanine amidase [Streptomyces sp. NPDC005492]|uniref:peptidoglycan recognition protein family protein n=1 Tax=Streptomyces sp. NPDC005492 TaxID=3156883 RepID=UPI0033A830C6